MNTVEVTEDEARALLRGMQVCIQKARSVGLEIWSEGDSEEIEEKYLAALQPWVFGKQGRKFLELVADTADGLRPVTEGDFANFWYIFRTTPYMHATLMSGDEISEKLMHLLDNPEIRVIIRP